MKIQSSFKLKFYLTVFTLFFYILFLPLILLLFLLYFLRWFVILLKILFRPDLGKILSPQSSFLASDNPYSDYPKWNLCVWLVLEGNIDCDHILETFHQNVVLRESKPGKLADPELQQYFTPWLGFLFWKWEQNFSIKNHSRFIQPNNYSKEEEDLKLIIKTLTWEAFKEGQSPWEFVWLRNYECSATPKTVMIFRSHHGLCDGRGIMKLLLTHLPDGEGDFKSTAKPTWKCESLWGKFKWVLASPVMAPYQFVKMMVEAKDVNEWHLASEKELTRPFNNSFSERIPLELIKRIRDFHGVSYNAVVVSAIAGGIRRTMMCQGKIVPEIINAGLPIPLPGHPGTMINHWTSAFIQLPVGFNDPLERLKKANENLNLLKKSYAPALNHRAVLICGAFPFRIIKFLNRNFLSTTTISNFPGPICREYFFGKKRFEFVDMNFAAGNGTTRSGLSFNMISFADGVRVVTEADKSILANDAAVEELNQAILHELDILASTKLEL